ncbi:MAG: 3-hydroxyisobutyrate dehydrogenase [Pararhodobacter sp.]|nr:3-hydroxyisobutyrate dehydrogenase [Pararhodobacter sp.]
MVQIAFIGLGNMGAPMARNLIRAGHSLKVFDLSQKAMKALEGDGAVAAESAAAAAADADFIISMLPADPQVAGLYLGEEGLISRLENRPVIMDCSTISPQTARLVSEAASEKGFRMIDAPVSGGVIGATEGSLSFMVGGDVDVFRECEGILLAMGKTPFHVGGAGAGQAAKICNNMLAAILMVGTVEAMSLAHKNGIDPKVITGIMLKSSGQNFMLERWNPWPGVDEKTPASNDYEGGFQSSLMLKDLGLALDSARAVDSPTPLASTIRNLFSMHVQLDESVRGKDFSIIREMYSDT